MATIITKDTLDLLLKDEKKRPHVIGRALVVLFHNQTETEKSADSTIMHNGTGFTGADARSGSMTAKFYLKHGTLLPWQVNRWMKPSKTSGYPRLAKYWRQLDQAAQAKAAAKVVV